MYGNILLLEGRCSYLHNIWFWDCMLRQDQTISIIIYLVLFGNHHIVMPRFHCARDTVADVSTLTGPVRSSPDVVSSPKYLSTVGNRILKLDAPTQDDLVLVLNLPAIAIQPAVNRTLTGPLIRCMGEQLEVSSYPLALT